jgi:uncharacterized membrane protein YkvA (DUF1232 family)
MKPAFYEKTRYSDLYALYLAIKDQRTPWPAKLLATAAVSYVFLPADFISDLVPVLGWIDDAAILSFGLWAAFRLVPEEVLKDVRFRTKKTALSLTRAIWVIIGTLALAWILLLLLLAYLLNRLP